MNRFNAVTIIHDYDDRIDLTYNFDRWDPQNKFLLGNAFSALAESLLSHGFTWEQLVRMVLYADKGVSVFD